MHSTSIDQAGRMEWHSECQQIQGFNQGPIQQTTNVIGRNFTAVIYNCYKFCVKRRIKCCSKCPRPTFFFMCRYCCWPSITVSFDINPKTKRHIGTHVFRTHAEKGGVDGMQCNCCKMCARSEMYGLTCYSAANSTVE